MVDSERFYLYPPYVWRNRQEKLYPNPDSELPALHYDWLRIIHQSEFWFDRFGERHSLSDMEPSHRENAANWLLNKIATSTYLRTLDSLRSALYDDSSFGPRGDAAWDAVQGELYQVEALSPKDWMKTKPLYRALTRT